MYLAVLTLSTNVNGDFQVPEQYVPILCPTDPTSGDCEVSGTGYKQDLQIWFTQIICTFVFVSVILIVKGQYTAPSTDGVLGAMAVMLTLGGLIHVAGHTAASFNPAVTVANTWFQSIVLTNTDGYLTRYIWGYTFGPIIGGLLAGVFGL